MNNAEQQIRLMIGDLMVQAIVLKDQLDKANEKIKELEDRNAKSDG
jgi:hypothetical protein